MKKLALFLLISIVFISCKEAITIPIGNNFYFKNPQPINDSELNQIPNKFLGIYIYADSIKLNFTQNGIFQQTNYKFRIHKKNIDSLKTEFEISNANYFLKSSKEVFKSKLIGDSIELSNSNVDRRQLKKKLQKSNSQFLIRNFEI